MTASLEAGRILEQIDRAQMVDLAKGLARIPSFFPDEVDCARFLVGYLKDRGFEAELQEVEPGRYNAVGRLPGSGSGKSLMFNGHLDMDLLPRGWKRDPWQPSLEGDRLYGAGLHNMKAGVATMVAAADAIRRSGVRLRGDIVIAGVVGELQGGVGSKFITQHGPKTDFAIVPEPFGTDNIITVHTGWAQAAVHILGRSRHISEMETGIDAIQKAEQAARALRNIRFTCTPRPDLPQLPRLLVGSIIGGQGRDYGLKAPNYVADFVTLLVDMRFNDSQSAESLAADIRRTLDDVKKSDPEFEYELELPTPKRFNGSYEVQPFFELPKGSYLLDAVLRAYRAVNGREPAVPGGAHVPESNAVGDTGHLMKAGVESLIYGPGHYFYCDLPDAPDTYTSVPEMERAARVMALTALDVCNLEG